MRLTRPALMISALAVLGCGSRADQGEPLRPHPRLSMAPEDLTSAVGTAPLQILLYNYADAVGAALLAPIADEIRLVSWPEGTPVPVTTQLEEFEPRREDGYPVSGTGKITVTPDTPLEDRWYFLHLAEPPATIELAGAMQLHRLADGRAGVRFTPASDPRMIWVRRCLGGSPGKVVVDFSEMVVLDSTEALAVEAPGACLRPGAPADRVWKSFTFACDGLASSTSVRVLVASSVTGVGGLPVRGAGMATEFPPAAFESGGDCPFAAVIQE
jgi:hypothetical protein